MDEEKQAATRFLLFLLLFVASHRPDKLREAAKYRVHSVPKVCFVLPKFLRDLGPKSYNTYNIIYV